jgi:endoribonuclease Dicer
MVIASFWLSSHTMLSKLNSYACSDAWRAQLEHLAGWEGTEAAVAISYTFDPGAPKFKVTRLKDVIRGVSAVLKQVGIYGAAVSMLDALKWLHAGAPDPRNVYALAQNAVNTSNPSQSMVEAAGVSRAAATAISCIIQAFAVTLGLVGAFAHPERDVSIMGSAAGVGARPWLERDIQARSKLGGRNADAGTNSLRQILSEIAQAAAEGAPLKSKPIEAMQAIISSLQAKGITLSTSTVPSNRVATGSTAIHSGAKEVGHLVASKTRALANVLLRYRDQAMASPCAWSAIIFVQQRLAAVSVAKLLRTLPELRDWVRVSPFMACGASFGEGAFTAEIQKEILARFKTGDLNVLVSTSVAEEGIDVRSCSLVVRFDPAATAQAFYQSRGRARVAGSHMVALVQHGDTLAEQALEAHSQYSFMVRSAVLNGATAANDDDLDDDEDLGEAMDVSTQHTSYDSEPNAAKGDLPYVVSSTGARVSIETALSLLMSYTSTLPADVYTLLRPVYRLDRYLDGMVRAAVHIPAASPVRVAAGCFARNKRRAKASAALEMCRRLHAAGALNEHLLPRRWVEEDSDDDLDEDLLFQGDDDVIAAGREAGLISNRGSGKVYIRCQPPAALSVGIKVPVKGANKATETSGVVTLHCYHWPLLESFVVMLPQPMAKDVAGSMLQEDPGSMPKLLGTLTANDKDLSLLMGCSDVLRRLAGPVCALEDGATPTYIVAPRGGDAVEDAARAVPASLPLKKRKSNAIKLIDWDTVREIVALQHVNEAVKNEGCRPFTALDVLQRRAGEFHPSLRSVNLKNRVLSTMYNKQRYVFRKMANNVGLQSPFPVDSQSPAGKSKRIAPSLADNKDFRPATYMEYYKTRWQLQNLDAKQPLVAAVSLSFKKSVLSDNSAKCDGDVGSKRGQVEYVAEHPSQEREVQLVPQVCQVHPVPAPLWGPIKAFPRYLSRFEGSLMAHELMQILHASGITDRPPLALIRQAITAPSTLDRENYETLETLGDTFIKYAVCRHLFLTNLTWHEGQLSAKKSKIVSNRRLASEAIRLGVDRHVRINPLIVKYHESDSTDCVAVMRANKLLADVVEALIGAFVQGVGHDAALRMLRVLGLIGREEEDWKDHMSSYGGCNESFGPYQPRIPLDSVEKLSQHQFCWRWIAEQAFTHASLSMFPSYQRLEFFGDALLDMMIVEKYLEQRPQASPSEIHDVRAAAVNAERLALVAIRHGFHRLLQHASAALIVCIDEVVEAAEAAVKDIAASMNSDGRGLPQTSVISIAWDELLRHNCFGLKACSAPKVLSDVVEALIAAVWLDSLGDFDTTWKFAERLMSPLPGLGHEAVPQNPVRRLHEITSQRGSSVAFEVLDVNENDSAEEGVRIRVSMDGVALGEGVAKRNRAEAKRLAAEAALEALTGGIVG